jgi:hypothetical protein
MDAEQAAAKIKNLQQTIYVPQHEYRKVDAEAFRHLDLKFYDRVRDVLVTKGCVCFGDYENITLSRAWSPIRTFVRMLVSEDRMTSIGLCHPKPKWWLRVILWIMRVKLGKLIDCETELSNGGFLVTSNALEAAKMTMPPGFDMKFFAVDTPHEAVFEAHQQRLKNFLAAHPDLQATIMQTADDVLQVQHRMQAAKAAYRKKVGYVTQEELQRMGADSMTAAKLKDAMDRPKNPAA